MLDTHFYFSMRRHHKKTSRILGNLLPRCVEQYEIDRSLVENMLGVKKTMETRLCCMNWALRTSCLVQHFSHKQSSCPFSGRLVRRKSKMASHASRAAAVARKVKPMLSSNDPEAARRRVFQLYKAWYRELPETGK